MHGLSIASALLLSVVTGCAGLPDSSTNAAFQADRISAQVAEGLEIAENYKASVSEAIVQRQRQDRSLSSVNTESLQLQLAHPKYVDSVEVSSGLIIVRFGHTANRVLAGKQIALIPASTTTGGVVWICGHAIAPRGLALRIPDYWPYTTVDDQYLPQPCRSH
jgi:hypothetical protein